MKKRIIATADAPQAIGPYSQGIVIEGVKLLFISGQIGLNPMTMTLVPGGVRAETEQVMRNIGAILAAAGGDFRAVGKTVIYLSDINDFGAVNDVYAASFASDCPARATLAAALPKGARVEIDAIAAL